MILTWDGTPLADDTYYYRRWFLLVQEWTVPTSEFLRCFLIRNPVAGNDLNGFDDGRNRSRWISMSLLITEPMICICRQVFLYNAVFAGINLEEADAMSPDQYKVVDLAELPVQFPSDFCWIISITR